MYATITKSESNMENRSKAQSSGEVNHLLDGKTIPEVYLKRVETFGNDRALLVKHNGAYAPVTWSQFHEQVLKAISFLDSHQFQRNDRICIFSQTRPEWMITDISILALGLITVPIYPTSSAEDISFILNDCDAKAVFVEDEILFSKLQPILAAQKREIPVVTFSSFRKPGVLCFSDLPQPKNAALLEERVRSIVSKTETNQMATIVYTSGTTGIPKGVVLTHQNLAAEVRGACQSVSIGPGEVTLTFLPLAHILGREESLFPIFSGITLGFAENLQTVSQDIALLKPTILVSVPRIYEKIFAKIQSEVQAKPALVQKLFAWAVTTGRKVVQLEGRQEKVSPFLRWQHALADKLVLGKIRAKLGGKLRFTISGGAPLSRELCETFHACGIRILEGYGLTETTGAAFVNREHFFRFGTVGLPLPQTEVKIANDGEILLRGPIVFKEYFQNPEATAEAFTSDGYFKTGDIGELDEKGCLRITDRKKELIVLSGGKKVAPQKIENLLKTRRFVSNAFVYGDNQKYLVALITLQEPEIKQYAENQNIPYNDFAQLVTKQEIRDIIAKEIEAVNLGLANYETIKKFSLIAQDFTPETGELTPSLKLKRKPILLRYKTQIDAMY